MKTDIKLAVEELLADACKDAIREAISDKETLASDIEALELGYYLDEIAEDIQNLNLRDFTIQISYRR
jgi:hypothetical protein